MAFESKSNTKLLELESLLKKEGFKYNIDREIYYNPRNKKIFSVVALEDNDMEWIVKRLRSHNTDWQFYFNTPPSSAVKKELESALHHGA